MTAKSMLACPHKYLFGISDSARESNPGLPTFSTKISKFYCSKNFKRNFQLKIWIIG